MYSGDKLKISELLPLAYNDKKELYEGVFNNMDKDKISCEGTVYTVRPGDTLFKIADRYNITVQELVRENPQIKNPDQLRVGQKICIPDRRITRDECAIVLSLSREATVALPAIAGGVVLVQRTNESSYALTFAATGLPAPETIGNFDTYIGSINVNGQQYSAVLRETAPFEQEPTWAGTRIIPVNPFNFPESAVTIVPFNIETDTRTNPILGGSIRECRR